MYIHLDDGVDVPCEYCDSSGDQPCDECDGGGCHTCGYTGEVESGH